jgi:endo-1,4-beta-xylanase
MTTPRTVLVRVLVAASVMGGSFACGNRDKAGIVLSVDAADIVNRAAITSLAVTVDGQTQVYAPTTLPGSLGIRTAAGTRHIVVEGPADIPIARWEGDVVAVTGDVAPASVLLQAIVPGEEPDGGEDSSAGTGGADAAVHRDDASGGGAPGTGGVFGAGGSLGAGGIIAPDGPVGFGGMPSAGGISGKGGGPATDAAAGTGGLAGGGGRPGTGGVQVTGGRTGTGGVAPAGGTLGTGGVTASGGRASGGATSMGGRTGSGGAPGTGGAPGRGGSTGAPPKFFGNIDTNGAIRSDFAKYWDQFAPENAGKWGTVQGSSQSSFTWASLDASYKYCTDNNIVFQETSFVSGIQQPSWTSSLSTSTGPAAVQNWMKSFCDRYPRAALIDVVSEPLHAVPKYTTAIGGSGTSGYDWIANAFKWAHDACPGAVLILNDYNNLEVANEIQLTIDVVNAIVAAGAPIHGIGCQTHGAKDLPSSTLEANIAKIVSSTGLPVYITQYDLNIADDNQQLAVMKDHVTMFWSNANVKGITYFGYIYGATWQTNTYLVQTSGATRPAMTWLMSFLGR